ncbi:MAG: hypothetical protein HUU22_04335 [Phycisphaerae bacterium]|nr:hypothetical protein [Phycisphaerae bacterium]NUQ45245.1 hypothetical protein [Phycisphaerae bacterium]
MSEIFVAFFFSLVPVETARDLNFTHCAAERSENSLTPSSARRAEMW